MKKLILALCGILMLSAQMAWGQAFPPNEAGVTMGHWHLNTRNIEATRKIFLAMGGTEVQGDNARVRFPGVLVILREQAATGGTVGSVVTMSVSSSRMFRNPLRGGRRRACRCYPVATAERTKRLL